MFTPDEVVLFGGSGQLGERIRHCWHDRAIVAPTRSEVDVLDFPAVDRFIESHKPEIVINATAFNNVPAAEHDPAAAFQLNTVAVERMAQASARVGSIFLTFSTDYVFDGTLGRPYNEADIAAPVNLYGASKYAGELLVMRRHTRAYVVRTSGLYGIKVSSSKGYSFIDRILVRARTGATLRIVNDQIVSPTYAGDLAVAIRSLVDREAPFGLYHAANEGAVSWFEFAKEVLRQAHIEADIRAISTATSETLRRPAYSALDNRKLRAIGIELPDWRAAIGSYLREKC